MFLADAHSKRIQSAQLKYDGFGVCAVNINRIIDYEDDWDSVISLCVSNNKLFVSHNEGVTVLDLASHQSQIVYKSQNARCTVVPFQTGILLTDQVAASLFKIDVQGRLQMFAGTGVKLKAVEMGLSQNANSNNQLVFALNLTRLCMFVTLNQTR